MKFKVLPSFTTGEVDQTLLSRIDYGKQASACRVLENFIVQAHGGVYRRPGTELIDALPGKTRLFSLQIGADVSYVILFSDEKVWIAANRGIVVDGSNDPIEIVSPYTEDDLAELYVTQSSDTLYICHPDYQVRKLWPEDALTWHLDEVLFGGELTAPSATAISFSKTPTNNYTQKYRIVGVTEEGQYTSLVSSPNLEVVTEEPDFWVAGSRVVITLTKPAGLKYINVYKEKAGYYGLCGIVEGDPSTNETGLTFNDENFIANTGIQPPEAYNPFEDYYPDVVEIFQQRLYFGHEQTVSGSQVGHLENFIDRTPSLADDAVEFDLDTGDLNSIRWMVTKGKLVIGTEGSEWTLSGLGDLAVSPSSVSVKRQSSWGSEKLKPLVIGNDILHVQRGGKKVKELTYSYESDGYQGLDRTVLASQIFRGRKIVDWAYQKNPDSIVWCVLSDGTLAAMTYIKEQDIWGWHRHETSDGLFESVVIIPGVDNDDVYFVVNRGGTRYLEFFGDKWVGDIADANYLDSSLRYDNPGVPVSSVTGLDHLEGKAVMALVNGVVSGPYTVDSGAITMQRSGDNILVGLNYVSTMSPLVVETEDDRGSSFGRQRSVPSVTFFFERTVGGKYGQEITDLFPFKYTPEKYGEAIQPQTGRYPVSIQTKDLPDGTFYVVQDQPLPMTILAIVAKFAVTGE